MKRMLALAAAATALFMPNAIAQEKLATINDISPETLSQNGWQTTDRCRLKYKPGIAIDKDWILASHCGQSPTSMEKIDLADTRVGEKTLEIHFLAPSTPKAKNQFVFDNYGIVAKKIVILYLSVTEGRAEKDVAGNQTLVVTNARDSLIAIIAVAQDGRLHIALNRKTYWWMIGIGNMEPLRAISWRLALGDDEYGADVKFGK